MPDLKDRTDPADTGPKVLARVDFTHLTPLDDDAAVVAGCMQKGGVGKTETVKGLGDKLSAPDKPAETPPLRVLFVDMDPNGTLSDGVGIEDDPSANGIASIMLGESDGSALDLVYAVTDNLHIIPTRDDLFSLNDKLAGKRGRELRLWRALQPLLRYYHVILIDCESNLGSGTDNALYATTKSKRGGVIVVVQYEGPCMRNFEILLDQIEALETELEVKVRILGWFGNLVGGTNVNKKFRKEFEALPLDKLGEMPVRVKIKEAWDKDLLLSQYMSPAYDANYIYGEFAKRVRERVA
ncbi:ParA family protein [Streptomyces sp. NPDC018045]|uniref:ParA family protein n=1 Tax=Streptomyces sp. NPDC018045 TaxID=3365037 RepID=UPI0037B38538